MKIDEGSIVWSRSTVKEKWWPSIVFCTWDAAKEAGFVLDGIAWLIECGRKVDITDDEAQPTQGEVLNLYLGETPEWEFIQRDEEHLLPFKINRAKLCKQRLGAQLKHQFGPALAAADAMIKQQQEQSSATAAAAAGSGSAPPAPKAKMAHMNPKRTGVLLDFGTGTSFASFAELWDYLRHNGWAILPGKGLASWYYFPPGSDPKMPNPVLRQHYFDSENAVIDHVRRTGLERPAPVGAAIPRSSPPSKARSGTGRLSGGRRRGSSAPPPSAAATPAAPPAASAKPSSSSKRKTPSSASEGIAAAAPPLASGLPAPKTAKVDTGPAASADDSAVASAPAAAAAAAPAGNVVAEAGAAVANGEAASGGTAAVDIAAPSAKKAGSAGAGAGAGGDGDDAAKLDAGGRSASEDAGGGGGGGGDSSVGGEDGDDDDDNDDELLVVEGLDDQQPSIGNSNGNGEACQDQRDRDRERNMEPPAVGGKRSHGRSMQVQAAHVSSPRGAPNLTRQVMRQQVAARRLANSPPAPCPSKKPKRAGPQLAPKELARLAKKQLGTIRKLLDGSGRAYPGPCGVERPVAEMKKFVKKAHSAWMASRHASSSDMQGTKNGGGAMILAGPPGAGKTTSFLAVAKGMNVGVTNVSTLRFATIKSDTLSADDRNDIFCKVLRQVTSSKASMDGDRALETLGRLTEPSRLFHVICVEDVREVLDPAAVQRLLDMAYRSTSSFAIVYMMSSIDRAIATQFEQGLQRRDCRMVHMLPCEEDRLRAILGQSLGAADANDKDGETVAGLVNKAALDIIAKTVARVCGNIRVALTICEVAFADRLKELEQPMAVTTPELSSSSRSAASPSPCGGGGGGGDDTAASPHGGGGGRGSGSCSPSPSSPTGPAVTASVLLTVVGVKNAINSVMQR